MKIALVRGKFLNAYEMQIFEPLAKKFDITAFGSQTSYHDTFAFPTVKLVSPMDLPDFPYKMQILNRAFIDAHYLFELENALQGFDIVHTAETYYRYTQQCLHAKRKGLVKKVVATVLENIPFNNEGIYGRQAFKKLARNELDHIIALTERTKLALILEGADADKITVISHGINTKRFTPAHGLRAVDKKHFTILFVGRLEKYKGVYEVLHAVKALLLDKDLRAYTLHVTIVGDGSEREKMRQREVQLGLESIVTHTHAGYGDMAEYYHQADIFVAPSREDTYWQEQYNTALLEAQASGLPIVTTQSGGIPENVGDAALLVSPGDVLSLAYAIKQFILHPKLRTDYAKRARKRAEVVHDVKIISRKIAKVYEHVLAS